MRCANSFTRLSHEQHTCCRAWLRVGLARGGIVTRTTVTALATLAGIANSAPGAAQGKPAQRKEPSVSIVRAGGKENSDAGAHADIQSPLPAPEPDHMPPAKAGKDSGMDCSSHSRCLAALSIAILLTSGTCCCMRNPARLQSCRKLTCSNLIQTSSFSPCCTMVVSNVRSNI